MNDTIYRQAAIDALNNILADYVPYLYGVTEAIPLDCAVTIQTLPSAQPEPQWIPCSERLPESENMYERPKHRYLCQRSVCGVNQMFVGARLNHPKGLLDDFWDWYGTKFRDEDVIAWMPLPEPYNQT